MAMQGRNLPPRWQALLKDSSSWARAHAPEALGKMGNAGAKFISEVEALLSGH